MRTGLAGTLLAFALAATIGIARAADPPVPAGSADTPLRIDEPRGFGYVVGDLLERRIEVELPAGRRLAAEAWPKPGRVGNWLELRGVEVDARREGARVSARVRYQLVNAPQKVTTVFLPGFGIRLDDGSEIEIAEWPVSASPLTPEHVLASRDLEAMQPDIVPAAKPLAPIARRLALWLAVLAVAAAWLAARRWPGLAFWRRDAPFRAALADLRGIARRGGPEAFRRAAERLHAAFDAAAGRALFAERLDPLFAARPRLEPMRAEVDDFYRRSRELFFASPAQGAEAPRRDVASLVALCRRLAQREAGR